MRQSVRQCERVSDNVRACQTVLQSVERGGCLERRLCTLRYQPVHHIKFRVRYLIEGVGFGVQGWVFMVEGFGVRD